MNTNTTSTRDTTGKEQADNMTAQARDVAGQAVNKASEIAGQAGDLAQQATGEVKRAAGAIAGNATNQIRGVVGTQLAAGVDIVKNVAQAANEAASHLEKDNPQFAGMIRSAASAAEQFSDQIRDKSVEDLVQITGDFARRQPALFLGGAVAVGFILARFAKSSSGGASSSYSNREG